NANPKLLNCRRAFPVLRKSFNITNLLRVVVTNKLESAAAERMRLLRLVTVLRNNRHRNQIRQQTDPRLRQRHDKRPRIGRLDAFDVTAFLLSRAFKKTCRLGEVARKDEIEGVLRICRAQCAAVMKLNAVTKCERKSHTIVRALDVRRKFSYVIELLIFLHQRVEDQRADTFAG